MKEYLFLTASEELIAVNSIAEYAVGEVYEIGTCIDVSRTIPLKDIPKYYYKNGNIFYKGSPPTELYTFNKVSDAWEITADTVNKVRVDKKAKIEQLRQNFSLQGIAYDNKILDADVQAQANINGKLQEIFAREAINTPLTTEALFWKDANNVIHYWANQNDYKAWLQGLVIAISSRNTLLYAVAWNKKAELEAFVNINDIIAYDVSIGW